MKCPICRSTRVESPGTGTAAATHDVLAVLLHWFWLLLVPLVKAVHGERGSTYRCLACGHIWRR